jgi:hypothetical protein
MLGLAARQAAKAPASGRLAGSSSDWKAPEADQTTDAGVEELFAEPRQALRFDDQFRHFGRYRLPPASRDGRVQGAQLGRLPGVIAAMQAIELAQHGGRSRTRLRLVQPGNQHFDAGAENKGFLMMQRRPAAGGKAHARTKQKD